MLCEDWNERSVSEANLGTVPLTSTAPMVSTRGGAREGQEAKARRLDGCQ